MRYIVYGAGAIGGLLGGLLTEAGRDTVLIARGAHLEALRTDGLTIESVEGSRTIPVQVAGDPESAGIEPGAVVLLGMKSQDTSAALARLRATASSATPIVSLQNGVENERMALRLFAPVYGVCVMCPATHLDPGVIQVHSSPVPGLLDIGRFPAGVDETAEEIAAAFRAATFESVPRADIMRWKYAKLLLNLSNAVEAVCGSPGQSELRRLVSEEGERILRTVGLDFASREEDHERRGALLTLHDVGGRRRGGGSSWQSMQRSTGAIESDYLNGEIVLLGRLHGLPTPVNQLLQDLAGELARQGAPPGSIPADEVLARLAADGVPVGAVD